MNFGHNLIQYYDSVKPGFKNKKSTLNNWYSYDAEKTGMKCVFCFYEG